MEIVLATPEKFDWHADLLGDGPGFDHVIVGEAASKSTTNALEMDGDVGGRDVQNFGDELAAVLRSLGRRPEFEFAIVEMSKAIFGLHGSVGEERIDIGGFDCFFGGVKSGRGVAVFAEGERRRLPRKLLSALEKAFAALLGGGTFVPGDVKFLASGMGLPPGVRNDGDAGEQTKKIGGTGNGEDVADAGLFFDIVEIGAEEFSSKDGTFFVDSPKHARDAIIDAVERLSRDDR